MFIPMQRREHSASEATCLHVKYESLSHFFDNTYVVLFRRIRFDKAFDRTSEHDLELQS